MKSSGDGPDLRPEREPEVQQQFHGRGDYGRAANESGNESPDV